ncbi:response regulator transcription factor [uncultured Adlercreutzia sp.]|uniref:response regulator transcription factor n=1 Tax=uncultured Adlercreutzia sp. TaxID=875803 RepID=UPI0026752932|nr:LuxR C-terminal-related transcriptional regulator [uncultured Adlercreutzia sp.]
MNNAATARPGAGTGPLSPSAFTVLACGLGFYLGWQTVGISPTLFPQPQAASGAFITAGSHLETVLFLVLLVALALFSQRRGSLMDQPALMWGAPLLIAAATGAKYLCGWVFDIPAGLLAAYGLKASKAVLFLLWAECLCRVRFRDTLLCVALGYAVTFALCLLVTALAPLPALIVHATMPLLSGALLWVLSSDASFMALPSSEPASTRTLQRLPWRLFLGVGILGAVILVVNSLSETKSPSAELFTLIAGLAVSLVTAAIAVRRMERLDFTVLYRWLTPLFVGSVILVLVLESGNQQYEAFAIGISWSFFRIFTWTLWCSIALRSHLTAACVFAAGQGALTACSTGAQLVIDYALPAAHLAFPVTVSSVIVIIVANSAFVMSESDVSRWFKRRSEPKAAAPESEESLAQRLRDAAKEFGLSKREEEIAQLVAEGKNNAVIQERLCITESTLRTHLRNIYGKAAVHSRQELVDVLRTYGDDL